MEDSAPLDERARLVGQIQCWQSFVMLKVSANEKFPLCLFESVNRLNDFTY